jgi:hypothetical protein
MDGNRFDDITRRLAIDTSRRSFLKRSVAAAAALTGLGSAAGASAARRPPNPSPTPVRCPGQQVASNGVCVCPTGLEKCGADCCPAGWGCCDGTCCDGECYGEEMCCPSGRIVCEGRCLEAGLCCTDADCLPGWACGIVTPHVCTCVPTVTCASSGRNCGPLTDDCGNILDCGTCQSPNTCGGGGTDGVCGCTVTTTCDGRCGDVPDNCGTTIDCGGCQAPHTCGGGGTLNECGCTVTTTCDGKCGDVVTNCGTTLSCGNTCQPPNTCGGGGTPNVCGCTVTTTCVDRCGNIPTNCDVIIDCGPCPEPEPCGGACGQCQTCDGTACVTAEDGTRCGEGCDTGFCIGGNCSVIHTIECPGGGGTGIPNPDQSCNDYQCVQEADGPRCVATPAREGGACSPIDECQTGVCTQGKCVGTDIDCGLCMECREGSCEESTGSSCGTDRRCVEGICSHFPSGTPPSDTDVDGICSDLKCADACCPGPTGGSCCASMDDCFLNDGGGFLNAFCCDPVDKCAGDCCWSGTSCAGGTVCRDDGMICADNPYCPEACCGGNGNPGTGTCCPSGQRCQNGACVAVPSGSCTSDANCPAGSLCAGLVLDLQTGEVVQAGTCCLSAYAYVNVEFSASAGQTVYSCCAAPNYVSFTGDRAQCCPFTDVGCDLCSCSTVSVRRWGH